MSRETKIFPLLDSTSADTTVNVETQLVSCVGVVLLTKNEAVDPESLRRRKRGVDRESGIGGENRINSRKYKIQYVFKLHGKHPGCSWLMSLVADATYLLDKTTISRPHNVFYTEASRSYGYFADRRQ